MNKKLYVGNLNFNTTEETLTKLFSAYGELESVSIVIDRYTQRPRGFAFVEMKTEEGATAAIAALNGQMVDGRELRVNEANPPKPREGGFRDREGGFRDRDRGTGNRNTGGGRERRSW